MTHLKSSEARTFHMHGVSFHSYAASASGASRLAGWRVEFEPHVPGQAHTMTEEEVLYVLSGELDVEVGADRFTARAGDAILVPAGAGFRVSNTTDRPSQAWATSLIGMRAVMLPGEQEIAPPWAG
ncbi:Cupin domain-containing protein [Nocardioides terrae]|uniref:Cupin domain-containing protein n=1 Tax=Nocardioides terrae TaxID=574651 RepID=A0A1I1GYC0_9ACTN|nr:cupin domain-containing protein [Nocardioides terrae]SFC16807.1 Cupin domain-containing protein [Nocardioides terrae]